MDTRTNDFHTEITNIFGGYLWRCSHTNIISIEGEKTMYKRLAMPKSVLFCCLAATFIATTFACGGCSVKKANLKPCEKNNVIDVRLDSLDLTSDCLLKPRGWINVTKTAKEFNSKWSFQKGVLKKSGESDGCKEMEKAGKDKESGGFLRTFGLPTNCPVEKMNKKINKDVDVSKYKDKMQFLNGPASGMMDISHGSTGRTCYTFDILVECKSG